MNFTDAQGRGSLAGIQTLANDIGYGDKARPGCRAAGLERRLQAVAGGRVTESSGGMPR